MANLLELYKSLPPAEQRQLADSLYKTGLFGGTTTEVTETETATSTSHNSLTGLSADDHKQYHNTSRADAWWATKDMDDLADGATYVKTHNDYTDTDQTKLGGIAAGAEVNVNADWTSVTGDSQILNKPATMPPDSHGNAAHSSTFITSAGVTYENLNGNSDVGTGSAQVAQGDHTHAAAAPAAHASSHISTGGDAIAAAVAAGASGLMTGSDKTKLDGIATGAEVNVNADWSSGSGDSQILNKPSTMTPTSHGNEAHSSTFITSVDVTYGNLNANSDVGTGADQVAQGNHTHAASGNACKETLTQAGHGFSAANGIRKDSVSGYIKAQADTGDNAEAIGVVESVDGDNFVVVYGGKITVAGAFAAETIYYLSAASAGALTDTEPDTTLYISKPLVIGIDGNTGIVVNMRGLTQATDTTTDPDVMDCVVKYVSTTQIKLAFGKSNQTTSHNGTAFRKVDLAAEPTLSSTANDIGGTAATWDVCYDLFQVDDSDTSVTLIARKWAVSTEGASSRSTTWASNTAYKIGDCRSNGTPNYYLCILAHGGGGAGNDKQPGVTAGWEDYWTDLGVAKDFDSLYGPGLYQEDGRLVMGPNSTGSTAFDARKYRFIATIREYDVSGAKFQNTDYLNSIGNFFNPEKKTIYSRNSDTTPWTNAVYSCVEKHSGTSQIRGHFVTAFTQQVFLIVVDFATSPSVTQWLVSATLNTVAAVSNAIGWGQATYSEMGVGSAYVSLAPGTSYLSEIEYGSTGGSGAVTFYGGNAISKSEVTFLG